MKKQLLFITAMFINFIAFTQNFQWAKRYGGIQGDVGTSIAVDGAGNIYSIGYFSETSDFDPGTAALNLTSKGGDDIFISKINASGNLVWAKSIGGVSDDAGNSIAVDKSGNIYITGYFNGTVDFDPGSGTSNLTAAGSYDIFVLKIDAAGNFAWVKGMGGAKGDLGWSLTLDGSGSIYITGFFNGTADFDPGTATYNLVATSTNYEDIFIAKLNASGNFVWAKKIGGNIGDTPFSIAVDASANVYTTGTFGGGPVDFDPGSGTFNLTTVGGGDIFISKLDSSGKFVWANNFGGYQNDRGNSIATDAAGNVYCTGFFKDTVDFDPGAATLKLASAGSFDFFISKFNSSGNLMWAKIFGAGPMDDWGFSLATDASGNVYTTGYFNGTVDFDPGSGTNNLTSASKNDIFILKLSSSGSFVWAKALAGADFDQGRTIAADPSGNVYVAGSFRATVDFDPGTATFNLNSAGADDVFLLKLGSTSGIENRNKEFNFEVYPNPANDFFTIMTQQPSENLHYKLTDQSGRHILSGKLNSRITSINIETLKPGFYFVQAGVENMVTFKLIKR